MSTHYEKDLFISYAHIDNRPLTASEEGWISRFHVSLDALLSMRLGKKARIWRDDKLQGNDVFADEIVEQFGRTAVLLSVLSPRYLKSRWCTREVTEFCARAEREGSLVVSNKARVFKVLKAPVPSEEPLPPLMKSLLGYEFFRMEDGAPMELDASFGDSFAQDFNRKVNKLAYEIALLLAALEDGPEDAVPDIPAAVPPGPAAVPLEPSGAPAAPSAPSPPATPAGGDADAVPDAPAAAPGARRVYLAECSFDRREEREILQAELTRLGHEVVPDRHLPRDEADYVGAVETLLAGCDLSVHLVGAHPGAVADGPSGRPLPVLQNELAAAASARVGLRRLIWLPEDTRADEPRQQAYIERLPEDGEAQRGADLITGGLESLKRAVLAELDKVGEEAESRTEGRPERTVHLLCTAEDRKETVPLRRFLRARGVEVTLPAFEGDAGAMRAANRRLLARCDVVLLYYGRGDEAWKRTVDGELRKLPAYRDAQALPSIHTYLAAPPTHDKEDLIDMADERLVDALDGLVEARMEAVLAAAGVAAEPA